MTEKKKYVSLPLFRLAEKNIEGEAEETTSVNTNANAVLRQQVNEIRDQIAQIREELRGNMIQPLIQRRLQRIQSLLSAFTQQQTSQKKAEKEAETVKCPQCGAEMPKTAKYCSECGSLLKPEAKWQYRGKIQLRS